MLLLVFCEVAEVAQIIDRPKRDEGAPAVWCGEERSAPAQLHVGFVQRTEHSEAGQIVLVFRDRCAKMAEQIHKKVG